MKSTDKKTKNLSESTLYDVVISGGGPVGLILAIGLAQQNKSVCLVEIIKSNSNQQNTFDGRVLALSLGSKEILDDLGIWQKLQKFITPISNIHISQKGYLGTTRLHAKEMRVPALGYSISASCLGDVLWEYVGKQNNINVICPAKIKSFTETNSIIKTVISTESTENKILKIKSKLIVGADGTNSKIRQILNLPIQTKSYNAFGLIAKIETEYSPKGWAFERFTTKGPVALLPMENNFSKAVLVCPSNEIEYYKSMNDSEFITAFTQQMGERLGKFISVSKRVCYPLQESYVKQMSLGRAVLMGNASHTQHPVAAQGLNLGIRDVSTFLNNKINLDDIGNPNNLKSYAKSRSEDHEKVMGMTNNLIQIFQTNIPIVNHLRSLGLIVLDRLPSLKKRFTHFAMYGVKK